ncbi:MAG: hypothetical protein JNG90_07320, partial [Planctomycetaceae bacterium]|nr:hypothetical protein [Planctomycetaceae bacterium]
MAAWFAARAARRELLPLALALVVTALAAAARVCAEDESQTQPAAARNAPTGAPASAPTSASLRGKVVWQAEALKRRFGIET